MIHYIKFFIFFSTKQINGCRGVLPGGRKNEKHREGVHDAFRIIMSEHAACWNRALVPCGGGQG